MRVSTRSISSLAESSPLRKAVRRRPICKGPSTIKFDAALIGTAFEIVGIERQQGTADSFSLAAAQLSPKSRPHRRVAVDF